MRLTLAAAAVVLTGCGHYADFALPQPAPGPQLHYRWEVRPEPVLGRGAPGEWDSVDVLNPSVVSYGGELLNLYSGFDGKTWHTGAATSVDGLSWTKLGKRISPDPATWEGSYIAANGSALADGSNLLYWYQAGDPPRIGLARSNDSRTWTKEPRPVLDLGPTGSWDERGLGDPYVIRAGEHFYLFYTGMDRARRQRLGVARSTNGVLWEKLRSNPILDMGADRSFDENGLGEPAIWTAGGDWWMLYTGRDRNENRRLGAAISKDGLNWTRTSAIPILSGTEDWNSKVICDPSVVVNGNEITVWFGTGNLARPDERLNGQIGHSKLIGDGHLLHQF